MDPNLIRFNSGLLGLGDSFLELDIYLFESIVLSLRSSEYIGILLFGRSDIMFLLGNDSI